MVAVTIDFISALNFAKLKVSLFSFRVFPAAAAMGVSRIVVPKSVFPPCCQEFILSIASFIILPMPISAKGVFLSAVKIPWVAAVLKLGAMATAEAKKCS